ncbi:hypothetical protein FKM82_007510 [Ascaphus truei]
MCQTRAPGRQKTVRFMLSWGRTGSAVQINLLGRVAGRLLQATSLLPALSYSQLRCAREYSKATLHVLRQDCLFLREVSPYYQQSTLIVLCPIHGRLLLGGMDLA